MQDYKKALVLTGGSIKGAYQAGAICEVLKTFEPDVIYGVSVGALNGAFILDRNGGDSQKELSTIGEELVDFWQNNIKSTNDVIKRKGYIRIFLDIILKKFNGILDTKPYEDLVKKTFSEKRIAKSKIDYGAGIVDLKTGKYFEASKTENKVQTNIIPSIIASGIVPILYPIKLLNEEVFVDGGIRNVAPFEGLNNNLNIQEIVCISCHPEHLNEIKIGFSHRNIFKLIGRIIETTVNQNVKLNIENRILRNQLLNYKRKNELGLDMTLINMKIIRPFERLKIKLNKFSANDIHTLIEQGKSDAKKVMENESSIAF